jgi:hypothetical protein
VDGSEDRPEPSHTRDGSLRKRVQVHCCKFGGCSAVTIPCCSRHAMRDAAVFSEAVDDVRATSEEVPHTKISYRGFRHACCDHVTSIISLSSVSLPCTLHLASSFSLSPSLRLQIFHARTRLYVPTLAYHIPRLSYSPRLHRLSSFHRSRCMFSCK